MKGTRHSEEQIIAILKQGEAGSGTPELCRQHGISEQTYYRWKAKYGGMESADVRFGYRRLTAMLTKQGVAAYHKRVYRLYREEGLAMRIRVRRRIRWRGPVTNPAASRPNERWSMDFLSDWVGTGKVIRMLTIVDGCTRECPAIEVDTSLGGGVCWIESPTRGVCPRPLWWTMGRSFAAGRWPPGVRNVGCDWSSFSPASRCRMRSWKASTAACGMNA